ncbi:MAG TPA: 5'-3' exonuclease H3TH domain-containing protein [Candidatus Margulisiibacteriota bacterium]|nr:5'-3' exonuclease H3TH domain-containing protein [Candidatus Margulisiibacteriota bacterium]
MAKLHLLDATYELFRAFFAMPSERGPDGREIGAIRGLIGSTLALLRDPGVTHIGAATDHIIESFRNQLFAGYKTGEGVASELLAQFPLAEEALRALGIVVWAMVDFEADDALASAAARFADQVEQVVILSPDKDLCQCVCGQHVVTFDRRRGKTYDEVAVQEKFGVPPQLIPDLLALVGDTADGIPGIPGFGMKTAATVLRAYGSIESIPDDPSRWTLKLRGAERLAATLADRRDDALLYKRLATLRTDAPIGEALADLKWRGVRRDAFMGLCRQLGFADLAQRPTIWAP